MRDKTRNDGVRNYTGICTEKGREILVLRNITQDKLREGKGILSNPENEYI